MNARDRRLQARKGKGTRTEIARSFSFKVSAHIYGGPQYESQDFFMSQKAECAIEDAGRIADALAKFCKAQVMKEVRAYILERGWRTAPLEPGYLAMPESKQPAAKANARAFEQHQRVQAAIAAEPQEISEDVRPAPRTRPLALATSDGSRIDAFRKEG